MAVFDGFCCVKCLLHFITIIGRGGGGDRVIEPQRTEGRMSLNTCIGVSVF